MNNVVIFPLEVPIGRQLRAGLTLLQYPVRSRGTRVDCYDCTIKDSSSVLYYKRVSAPPHCHLLCPTAIWMKLLSESGLCVSKPESHSMFGHHHHWHVPNQIRTILARSKTFQHQQWHIPKQKYFGLFVNNNFVSFWINEFFLFQIKSILFCYATKTFLCISNPNFFLHAIMLSSSPKEFRIKYVAFWNEIFQD